MKNYLKPFNQLKSILEEIINSRKEVTKPFKVQTGLSMIKLP